MAGATHEAGGRERGGEELRGREREDSRGKSTCTTSFSPFANANCWPSKVETLHPCENETSGLSNRRVALDGAPAQRAGRRRSAARRAVRRCGRLKAVGCVAKVRSAKVIEVKGRRGCPASRAGWAKAKAKGDGGKGEESIRRRGKEKRKG